MASALNRRYEHALVLGASSGDALRYDSALLRHESLEFLLGFVIHVIFLVVTESAGPLFPYLAGSPALG